MSNPTIATIPSIHHKVSAEEWQTRVDLAACYRLVAHFHWDDLVFTHITAKIPGTENQFLINPYGKTPCMGKPRTMCQSLEYLQKTAVTDS